MNFIELLRRAKAGDRQALDKLMAMYKFLIVKEAKVDNAFDEDLYQDLWLTFMNCVRLFNV